MRGRHLRLRLTAAGLLFYAAALVIDRSTLSSALILIPPVLWAGSILHLDQRIIDEHPLLYFAWKWLLLPMTLLLGGFFLIEQSLIPYDFLIWLSVLIGFTPLLWTLLLIRDYSKVFKPRQAAGILFIATIFFGLGEGFLLFPAPWLPQEYMLPAIGLDLLLLGFCMAWFDAYDEGESFFPDMIRSLVLTLVVCVIFTGQVAFIIVIQSGLTEEIKSLLISTLTASILLSVSWSSIQQFLDGFAFSRNPSVRDAKMRLATEAVILSRKAAGIDLSALSEEERSRLTRRALSHFGDLHRLASNPLTQLPMIDWRLQKQNIPDTTLDRANELKLILSEAVIKLKPKGENDFGVTDEWRFYNSVFFPYVAGLKPYSRNQINGIMGFEKDALNWFRTEVPERTLHNWQNAAAKLIANDLWENNFPEER